MIVDTRVRTGVLTIDGSDFSCQPTSVAIAPSTAAGAAGTELEVLCGDKISDAGGAEDFSATLDITQIADFANAAGLQALLWTKIGQVVDFVWQPTADVADSWTGKVKIQPNTIGGTVGERLQPTVSLEITELNLPSRLGGAQVIPYVPPAVAITGVTAGTPGSFQPGTATLPADLAALKANSVVGDAGTAKPADFTSGQYVVLGDGSEAYLATGTWTVGRHP